MKRMVALLIALCVMFSLVACGAGPKTETSQGPVSVSTVDELLAAIAPGAVIHLTEGVYSLSSASDYGVSASPYYSWTDLGQGEYGLQLESLEDLTLSGAGKTGTSVITEPRWANVLSVSDCKNITIENMTLGHTVMTEACEGGVIYLDGCVNTSLKGLGLYGCGTLGVMAFGCGGLEMEDCEVYDCSIGGVQLSNSNNVSIQDSSFHSLGKQMPVQHVFNIGACEYVDISDCSIFGNYLENMIWTYGNGSVTFRNNQITGNKFSSGVFCFQEPGFVMEGNDFSQNSVRNWYTPASFPAMDASGNEVFFGEPEENTTPVTPGIPLPVSTGEQKEVRVSTVQEFLDAIDSDTCIILEAELLDFSQCEEYETLLEHSDDFMTDNPAYYPERTTTRYWVNEFDGPALVIYGVKNLTIMAEGEDRTVHTLSVVPRYADVLTFENCSNITLSGFTAGHTIEPGECTGGVFLFDNCEDILIENCGMYGCGTEGFNGQNSRNIQIVNSEIYECSYTGIELDCCENVSISGTIIRDIANDWEREAPYFNFYNSKNVTLDGISIDGNYVGR